MSNEVKLSVNNNDIIIKQETDYPWSGNIKVSLNIVKPSNFTLAFRLPDWCNSYTIKLWLKCWNCRNFATSNKTSRCY